MKKVQLNELLNIICDSIEYNKIKYVYKIVKNMK
jgi:hypothetical protein